MNTVVSLRDTDDRSQRFKAFRKQFADNFNLALDRRGAIPAGYGRVTAVAELFGVSQNTAANWLRGDGVPELPRMPEIAETLNTTVEQLINGDTGNAHFIDETYTVLELHSGDEDESHAIYMLPEALRELGLPRGCVAMRISADDMDPYLRPGDIVIYDPRVTKIIANGVYVLRLQDSLIVRRIQRGTVGDVHVKCDNDRFGSETLSQSEFAMSGIEVVGLVASRMLVGR